MAITQSPAGAPANDGRAVADSTSALRRKIRQDLPPEVFCRRPGRALLVIPIVGTLLAGSVALAVAAPPWYIALLGAILPYLSVR